LPGTWEWVADWHERACGHTTWPSGLANPDSVGFAGDGSAHTPGALVRGRSFFGSTGYPDGTRS
jgi:hypothetical protein